MADIRAAGIKLVPGESYFLHFLDPDGNERSVDNAEFIGEDPRDSLAFKTPLLGHLFFVKRNRMYTDSRWKP